MAIDLLTPILNDRTRAVRFFNGRLLSGEAMTDEQSGQRAARALLAQAVGDGIAHGFEVAESAASSTTRSPVVAVAAGVAINRRGEILLLAGDTEVQLVRPPHQAAAPPSLFQTCTPPQAGVYVADSGVYLLTVCSIGAANGLAEVSGLGGIQAGCNAKYVVDAVQFRLLEVPVDGPLLSDVAHLRNRVAYQCFGVDHLLDFATDPFGAAGEPRTLLDDLRDSRQLTDCDVPLALMYWTATGGIQFLDLWSVRRRVTRTQAPAHPLLTDRRLAVAEAMTRQFQAQLDDLLTATAVPANIAAQDFFAFLPPIGFAPLAGGGSPRGIAYASFFAGRTYKGPLFVNGAKLDPLLRSQVGVTPIDLRNAEMVWLYTVVQNIRAINLGGATAPRPYLLFTSGQIPYQADAQSDVSYWNYSNFT
jgi:hypothetical protein